MCPAPGRCPLVHVNLKTASYWWVKRFNGVDHRWHLYKEWLCTYWMRGVVMSHAVPRDCGAERITMAHAQGSLEAIG